MNIKYISVSLLFCAFIGPATVYAADTTNDTATEYMEDATITARVKVALTEEKMIKSRDISIRTDHGVVDLTGKVSTKEESDLATNCATKVKGVRSVHNNLTIS